MELVPRLLVYAREEGSSKGHVWNAINLKRLPCAVSLKRGVKINLYNCYVFGGI